MTLKSELPAYLHRAYDIFLSELKEYDCYFAQTIAELGGDQESTSPEQINPGQINPDILGKARFSALSLKLHRLFGGSAFFKETELSELARDGECLAELLEESTSASPLDAQHPNLQELLCLLEKIRVRLRILQQQP
jgi:hypothetical protein